MRRLLPSILCACSVMVACSKQPLTTQKTVRDNTSCGENHGMAGVLSAKRNAQGVVIGWTCTMGVHAVCTAGADGVWKECTEPPDMMKWPEPVSADVLRNPPVDRDAGHQQ